MTILIHTCSCTFHSSYKAWYVCFDGVLTVVTLTLPCRLLDVRRRSDGRLLEPLLRHRRRHRRVGRGARWRTGRVTLRQDPHRRDLRQRQRSLRSYCLYPHGTYLVLVLHRLGAQSALIYLSHGTRTLSLLVLLMSVLRTACSDYIFVVCTTQLTLVRPHK